MSDTSAVLKFENAPGVVVRQRKVGWMVFWQCRSDIAKKGFRPAVVPLWRGIEPSRIDRTYIAGQCVRMQNEMLTFAHGTYTEVALPFDGTIRALISNFKADPDSSYQGLRYRTRENYDSLCRRIEKDMGDFRIEEIDARKVKRQHQEWSEGGKVAMAHSLVGMLRTLCTFGATMLKSKECRALKTDLHDVKFKMPKARNETLSSDQAAAVISKAHDMNLSELALAQAIQFECTLRQKDVIGEWVPDSEPGLSDVTYAGMKWLRGIRWNEIDDDLILKHITSKRGKEIEVDLTLAPMVLREFKTLYGFDVVRRDDGSLVFDRSLLPATGPVIIYREQGRPFVTHQFRRIWRKVADFAGLPKHVKNMDTRAGAITEATDSGANIEDVRHAATHSNISMTSRYSRGAAQKTAAVMRKRVEFRRNKE